ncbi:type VII secretion system-associated protein [Streptomyces sp. NPDC007856]|uniref:type VII secretion system-associated protein n=1 Tax=Streptomyces sp. NPDC007856 TaxID=3364781 RepID=UPI0036A72DE1
MADASLTKLDATALQAFIDTDLSHFLTDIEHLRAPGQTPLALYDVGNGHPLVLGNLEGDDNTGGKNLVTNTKTAATAIDAVLNKHKTAFTNLKSELHTIITTMLKTKDQNLQSIEAQKFLKGISGYEKSVDDGGTSGNLPSNGDNLPLTGGNSKP